MSDEQEDRNNESTEDLHRGLGDVTEPDPSAGLEGRLERAQEIPDHIGPFKILEILGEGGMGVVYLAEQTEPIRRRVALKLVKLGMDTKQVIARFESERQALALMNHPNVAKVFDAGATEAGRPYFVMEHVPGVPITEYCDQHRLNTSERLELFDQVCHAVQHAHQKGIIHRDIKPSNILVTVRDGQPVPKVIDFGVAKATQQRLTEKTLFTEQGQLIGTPEYMSPEQAEMTALDIDTRTDIYSLGVLLYELLTGALPFDPRSLRRAGFAEIQRIIREVDPPKPSTKVSSLGAADNAKPPEPRASARANAPIPEGAAPVEGVRGTLDYERFAQAKARGSGPGRDTDRPSGTAQQVARQRRTDASTLVKQLRGDLDWITMKALEKDRTRRYATATDLAADIDRHLKHEPVLAGPPGASYRARKFVRRNRGLVAALVVITLVLLAATVVSIGFALSETRQRRIAETATQEAELARASEETQRLLAQQREADAVAAEQEQTRALKEAEQARAAEEEQRKLAEQRADELKTVTEFQQSMLGEIDAEKMGRGIIAELRQGIREGMQSDGVDPEEVETALASFDGLAEKINATDLALKIVDENVLARAVETIHEEFADHPLVRAALQQAVANTYRKIGLYEPAMPLQEACLRTRRRELGDDHPDTLGSINNMGMLLQSMGQLTEAEPYCREALEGRRRVLGDDHPNMLTSINEMGVLLNAMGKYAEAEPYYREALEGRRRVLGDDHPSTLGSINNMGVLLNSMGKYAEAEVYYREDLEGSRRVLGGDHPETLTSINNMGYLLKSMGKYAEAEPYYRESLEGKRRVLGDDHPHTLNLINNMGALLYSMGKLADAERYFREALERRRRVLGDDHPHTLQSIGNMGALLQSMGKYAEAEPYYREALEGKRRILGDDHAGTLISIISMGSLLRSMGKYAEAEPYCREGLEGHRRVLGDDHPNTLTSINEMGVLLKAMAKYAEAEPYFREGLEGRRRVLGDDHPNTLTSINNMGDLLNKLGRYEDSVELLLEGEAAARRVFVGGNARRLGDYLAKLGEAQTGLGSYPQAKETLLEAHELLSAGFGEDHVRTTKTVKRLITLYESWDAAEPGKGYAEQAAVWKAKLGEEATEVTATKEGA